MNSMEQSCLGLETMGHYGQRTQEFCGTQTEIYCPGNLGWIKTSEPVLLDSLSFLSTLLKSILGQSNDLSF